MFGRIRAAAGNIANRVRSAFSRSRGSSSGRSNRCSDHWDDRQRQYVMDTAIVHALVYGSNDFGALAELHKRLAFMGLTFED